MTMIVRVWAHSDPAHYLRKFPMIAMITRIDIEFESFPSGDARFRSWRSSSGGGRFGSVMRLHSDGSALENEEARLKRELDNDTHAGTAESWRQNYTCRHVELPTEDPAARAKRELGEWLATDYHSRKARLQTRAGDRFRMALYGAKSNPYVLVTGEWCATEYEAITTALRAAKGSGR